jgi:hypothetical protein
MNFQLPQLTESSFGEVMKHNLSLCHENRIQNYNVALNVGIFIGFALILGLFLYYRYKNRPTKEERMRKMQKDQQFILERIRFYQTQQRNMMASPLGNL